MRSLLTVFLAVLVFSMMFISLPNNSNAGTPTFPPITFAPNPGGCCQYIGTGLENAGQDICSDIPSGFICPIIAETDFENFSPALTCNEASGRCEAVRNVPTLSEYGLIAMAVVMGFLGYILLRRRKATA